MAVTEAEFQFISDLLHKKLGIRLEKEKGYLVESRLTRVAEKAGLTSLAKLLAVLQTARPPEFLVNETLEAMTTNETYFFRDIAPFDALKEKVLPTLLAKRKTVKSLNIWSAACSTGQEPYSIAMTLRESLPHLTDWSFHITGTDAVTRVIGKAQDGLFTQTEAARGLSQERLAKHFNRESEGWRVREEIRKMVSFRPLNLMVDWPHMPKMDVIFLRNVLIYMDEAGRSAIFRRIHKLLQPDGYLFLGAAETTFKLSNLFQRMEWERAGCFRPV